MKKLIAILKKYGIEVPTEKEAEIKKDFYESFKSAEEHSKTVGKVEADRDAWKERAEKAENAIKKFDGLDPDKIQNELADWKKKAEDAKADYEKKISERDFEDALAEELKDIKFSSSAAKEGVLAKIRAAGLPVKDRKILGLKDLMEGIQKEDASAFSTDGAANPHFTTKINQSNNPDKKMTKADIMKIRDASERQRAIAENMNLFKPGE